MTKLLLSYGRMTPTAQHLANLAAIDARLEFMVATSREEALAQAGEAVAFLGHAHLQPMLPMATELTWVQALVAGVDSFLTPALLARRPILTRCPIFSDVIAFHAVAMAYAVVRRLPEAARAQTGSGPHRPPTPLPEPRTALILGLGTIGLEIAARLRATGVTVRGVATSASPDKVATVDEFLMSSEWWKPLPETDLLFITLPGNDETAHMVNDAALALLPAHAVVINVGRGQVLDTSALARRLRAGALGGAALDVVEPTPAAEDPFWQTPHLLVTPHMASFTPERQPRIEAFVEEQVRRFVAGEPLLYPVVLP